MAIGLDGTVCNEVYVSAVSRSIVDNDNWAR